MQSVKVPLTTAVEWHSWPSSAAAQLIDVRSPTEYSTGHIPAAINVPMDEFESRSADFMKSGTLILACQSGARARLCAQKIAAPGLDVRVLDGGTNAWEKLGLPLVVSTRSSWSLERQVRFGAGLIVLTGLALGSTVSEYWIWLSVFAGLGLTFAGMTNICVMGNLLSRMPWNQTRPRVTN